MPNLKVIRPCDAVETAEAWEIALTATTTPTLLVLSRQNLPTLRTTHAARNRVAEGAYVLREAGGAARRDADRHRIGGRDRHRPRPICWPPGASRAAVVSRTLLRALRGTARGRPRARSSAPRRAIGVEAAIRQGWDLMLRRNGRLRRHDRLWRLGPGAGALPPLRHHRRSGRRRRAHALRLTARTRRNAAMALITLRQLLDHAAEHGYGVPAFNINNMEQGLAIMEAARGQRCAGDPAGQPRRAVLCRRHHAAPR